ncbi:hypothetical protein FM120_04620 [Sphingobacterium faecium PCAi_F2.5]|nr:hypothetical protein FM120_04620 [Sphingobacterium faecium PCAi_F2.5]
MPLIIFMKISVSPKKMSLIKATMNAITKKEIQTIFSAILI